MSHENETGADHLRRVVRAMNMTSEWAFDNRSPEECIRMIEACWLSDWDILPDELEDEERDYAAKHGKLPEGTNARLKKVYG